MAALQATAVAATPSSLAVSSSLSSVKRAVRPATCSHNGLRLVSSAVVNKSRAVSSSRKSRVVCEATETQAAGAVSDATFKELVLDSDVPVLVDFWAPWCGPCRMIAPLIDELAVQYAGRIRCLKLNTDDSPGVATEYGIRSIPTVMIFKGGKKVDTVIGAVPKSTLTSTIDKYL